VSEPRDPRAPMTSVHIDELVIDGATGSTALDPQALAAAVEAELGRRVGEGEVQPAHSIHARLDGGTLAAPAGSGSIDATALGRRVAAVLHGALGGER
jgi:hypothetical protein